MNTSSTTPSPWVAPRLIQRMAAFNAHMMVDFLGGPKVIKLNWVINGQKGGTFIWVLMLMVAYQRWTLDAWVYLALHGTYGFLWLLKDVTFPDPGWQRRATVGSGLAAFTLVLGPYWTFSWLLISDGSRVPAPPWLLALVICMHTVGAALMLGADAQKFFTLRVRRGLIEDGFFRYIRHPNYTGEMLIYASYAVLVGRWFPWVVLAWVWGQLFLPNMLMKEQSMSRHPTWAAYKARTGMLLPSLRALLGASGPSSPAP